MTSTKTGASRAPRGASGTSETNGHKRGVKFRGLKLDLPAKSPGEVVFAIADDEISEALRILIGREQYVKVRAKCVEEELGIEEVVSALRDLLTDCMSVYGIGAGE